MNYKCKICGGTISIDHITGIAICDYCGTKQSLPQFTDESARLLYERGNNYLLHNEYDKAENIFNQLLAINPSDPEIYWDLVMCKYGVTFVCDPKTGKYIPTCNRTHYVSIFNDDNYLNAIKYSTGEKLELYKSDAKTIDDIQKGILAVSKKEKPFDIFISYKETNEDGTRTKDSVVAQELYEKLTVEGYKVFFSRITLESKIGTEYEPYIYAALSSSKVMLTISSSKENIEAAWVKNEWSRFLTLRQGDASKTLIPLYFDMTKSALPEEFAILSAQDMKKEGFEQELIRGIKKLIPLPIMLAERRRKIKKRLGIASLIFVGVLGVAGAISAPYIKDYMDYQTAISLYDAGNYLEAVAAFEKLGDFSDAKEMITKSEDAQIEVEKTKEYEAAMQLYYDSNYPEAAWAFRDLEGFKDSAEMQDKCERAWRESLATVAVDVIGLGENQPGSYYISSNGTVETFSYNPGTENDGIEINSHGKLVSLSQANELYALYEDGYVYNSANNNGLNEDWIDVIQITPKFNFTNVALKNNGTVVYGNIGIEEETEFRGYDGWLTETASWTDIVSLSWDWGGIIEFQFDYTASLAGIDKEGNVHFTMYNGRNQELDPALIKNCKETIASLTNIKEISISGLNFAALDNDGNLITYIDGEVNIIKNVNYDDVEISWTYNDEWALIYEIFAIDNKKLLSKIGSENTIMEDVVYISDGFIVSRSGNIYSDYNAPVSENAKTEVKDVWLVGD